MTAKRTRNEKVTDVLAIMDLVNELMKEAEPKPEEKITLLTCLGCDDIPTAMRLLRETDEPETKDDQ